MKKLFILLLILALVPLAVYAEAPAEGIAGLWQDAETGRVLEFSDQGVLSVPGKSMGSLRYEFTGDGINVSYIDWFSGGVNFVEESGCELSADGGLMTVTIRRYNWIDNPDATIIDGTDAALLKDPDHTVYNLVRVIPDTERYAFEGEWILAAFEAEDEETRASYEARVGALELVIFDRAAIMTDRSDPDKIRRDARTLLAMDGLLIMGGEPSGYSFTGDQLVVSEPGLSLTFVRKEGSAFGSGTGIQGGWVLSEVRNAEDNDYAEYLKARIGVLEFIFTEDTFATVNVNGSGIHTAGARAYELDGNQVLVKGSPYAYLEDGRLVFPDEDADGIFTMK